MRAGKKNSLRVDGDYQGAWQLLPQSHIESKMNLWLRETHGVIELSSRSYRASRNLPPDQDRVGSYVRRTVS